MGCKSSDKPKPKPKHRKGLWSPEEDQRLRNYVLKYGHSCWSSVPINAGLQRNGKSCRLRWINYLRPGLKRGTFTAQEEETILTLHRLLGNKWSQIAHHLPGRTDNEVKNYWHSYLKKRVLKAEGVQEVHSGKTTIIPNNMEHPESPRKHNIPTRIYDTSETKENSSSDCSHLTVPQVLDNNKPKDANKNPLPKLMFAEWLSLDSFANLGEALVSTKGAGFDHLNYPSFQDIFMNGNYLYNYEIPFGSEYQNSLSDGSAAGDVFKFEGQSSASDQFVEFNSGDDICSDFNVNNDVIAMYTRGETCFYL